MNVARRQFMVLLAAMAMLPLLAGGVYTERIKMAATPSDRPLAACFAALDTILEGVEYLPDPQQKNEVSDALRTYVEPLLRANSTAPDIDHWEAVLSFYYLLCTTNIDDMSAALDSLYMRFTGLPDSHHKALFLRHYGNQAIKEGRARLAHESLLQAVKIFREEENWDYASLIYYELAIDDLNVGDTILISAAADSLRLIAERHPSPITAFNYHSVSFAHYSMLMSMEPNDTTLAILLDRGRQALDALNQIPNCANLRIVPAWNYYNLALMFDFYFDPPQVDSITYYLDKAEMAAHDVVARIDSIEVMISVNDLRAWLCFYEGKYRQAETMMFEVLALIDSVAQTSPATVVTERGEAYAFLVELYETTGNTAKALTYQKLLTDNNMQRYDINKNRALHEVAERYELQIKEERISRLEEQNAEQRKSLIFTIVIALVTLLALVLLVGVLRLRHRHTQQKLYEAALVADAARSELALQTAEIERVKKEHERLKKLSARDKANATRYANDLADIQRRIDISPAQLLRERLLADLEHLSDKLPYKNEAIKRLSELDAAHVSRVFAQASEPLSAIEKKYIICFIAGIKVEDIAAFFCVEPASVYTVRYRIKKKYPNTQKQLF